MTISTFSISDYGSVEKATNRTTSEVTYGANLNGLQEFPRTAAGGVTIFPEEIDYITIYRGAMLFNTSAITAGGTVSKVEFFRKFTSPPSGGASVFQFDYYLRSYSASTLTKNQDLYDGGTLCYSESGASFTDGEWIDLGATACTSISKTGYTALKIANPYNDAYPVGANSIGSARFETATNPCQLRVTYTAQVIGNPRRTFISALRTFLFKVKTRVFVFGARERQFVFKAIDRSEPKTATERIFIAKAKDRSRVF